MSDRGSRTASGSGLFKKRRKLYLFIYSAWLILTIFFINALLQNIFAGL